MMMNIRNLDTKKRVSAFTFSKYSIHVLFYRLYAINDNSNSVLIYQNRYKPGDEYGYDWVAKYDVHNNREVWAYRQTVKYKAYHPHRGSNTVSFLGFTGGTACIHVLSTDYYLDGSSHLLSLRDMKTGHVVPGHPLNKKSSSSYVASQDGYLLLWDKGVIECYRDLRLIWKKSLASKPHGAFLHGQACFVLFFKNQNTVVVCDSDNGSMKHIHVKAPFVPDGWCETKTGVIYCSDSKLYELNLHNEISQPFAGLPSDHVETTVVKTNPDYFMLFTTVFRNSIVTQYYQVFNISTKQLVGAVPLRRYTSELSVVGIGDHVIAFPPVGWKDLGLYNIDDRKMSYQTVMNIGPCDQIIPLGDHRIISYSSSGITIIG
ncbi:MAG: hypothetical protein ACYC1M_05100 [Armatimonadota bacterium]